MATQNAKSTLGAGLVAVEALLTLFVGTSLALLTAIWQPLSAGCLRLGAYSHNFLVDIKTTKHDCTQTRLCVEGTA